MWRVAMILAGLWVAGYADVAAASDVSSLRPLPRPAPPPDPRALIRPVMRPVTVTPEAEAPDTTPPEPPVAEATTPDEPAATLIGPSAPVVPAAISPVAPAPALMRPPPRPPRPPRPEIASNSLIVSSRPPPRPASLRVTAAVSKPVRITPPKATPPTRTKPTVKPAAIRTPKPAALPQRNVDIVMIGDSLTAGGHWAKRFPGVKIANRGVSGDTGLKILARMDGILATHPKRALVMFGINDIYNGVPVDRIFQRYERIVSILQSRKIEVVIQSTLACTGAICGEKLAKVHALNAKLRAMAKKRRLKFVDINRGLSDRGGLKASFSRDGVHMNGNGYAQWYATLKPFLRRS